MSDDQTLQLRHFTRTLTQRIGALGDDYLGTGRPLAEARLMYEIGLDGATVRDLRGRLALDSGYLSRLLRSLEAQGITRTGKDADDARVRVVKLTAKGRKAWTALDRRSEELAASLLDPLSAVQKERLLAAMAEVSRLLRASAVVVEPVDPAGEAASWCLQSYCEELQGRFDEGFDPRLSESATPDELVPPHGLFLVARVEGRPIGCGALKLGRAGRAEIKRVWVAEAERGMGVARRLLHALEWHAAQAGANTVRLDTHRQLTEARRMYERHGYVEIDAYNTNPYAHHWYEKRNLRRLLKQSAVHMEAN